MKLLRNLVLLALLAPLPATAGDCVLAMALDARIVAVTGDPPLTECPVIGRGLPASGGMRSQAGAFDPVTWRIDLAPDLDLATAEGQGYLLHELVHHAQARGGRTGRGCEGVLEAEAYALQAQFLRDVGQTDDARIIGALGALLGQCPA